MGRMSCKNRFLALVACVVCLLVVSFLAFDHEINFSIREERISIDHTRGFDRNQTVDYSEVHLERIQLIQEQCGNTDLLSTMEYHGSNGEIFYQSKQYNFTYCKVPKSGSTFWTQAFSILEFGESIFTKKRILVHGNTSKFTSPFKSITSLPAIIVSRDPFSRLYSAYVDKIYLMLFPGISETIRDTSSCTLDVSFEEFLIYVIGNVRSGDTLDRHWAPIYSLCKPCDANTKYLLKQETFAEDVDYILTDIGVDEEKLDNIISALHEHRIEYTIPGIIETVFGKTNNIRNCISSKLLVKRLWESFQIQGYARNNITDIENRFPDEDKYNDVKYISELFLKTINENKMSSSESKQQRLKALVEAYKGVSSEVKDAISNIYKVDITMFGYNDSPPVTYDS